MSNLFGKYETLRLLNSNDAHGSKEPYSNVRENWMGPALNNFTGCGGAGWNQGNPPCASCGGSNGVGSRICNDCRPQSIIRPAAGMQPASWIPETYRANTGPRYMETKVFNK